MTFDPLLHASPTIQIHAGAAVAALVVGGVVLFRRKGDAPHKRLGRVWVGLMVIVCVGSLFIWEIRMVGLFSPIHLLSIVTLILLYRSVMSARKRQVRMHRGIMQGTYFLALIVTGFFTFMPGRIMYQVAFGN